MKGTLFDVLADMLLNERYYIPENKDVFFALAEQMVKVHPSINGVALREAMGELRDYHVAALSDFPIYIIPLAGPDAWRDVGTILQRPKITDSRVRLINRLVAPCVMSDQEFDLHVMPQLLVKEPNSLIVPSPFFKICAMWAISSDAPESQKPTPPFTDEETGEPQFFRYFELPNGKCRIVFDFRPYARVRVS